MLFRSRARRTEVSSWSSVADFVSDSFVCDDIDMDEGSDGRGGSGVKVGALIGAFMGDRGGKRERRRPGV